MRKGPRLCAALVFLGPAIPGSVGINEVFGDIFGVLVQQTLAVSVAPNAGDIDRYPAVVSMAARGVFHMVRDEVARALVGLKPDAGVTTISGADTRGLYELDVFAEFVAQVATTLIGAVITSFGRNEVKDACVSGRRRRAE